MPPDNLDELATPRAGILRRSELLESGWSSTLVDRAIARGDLLVVTPGVYRTAGAPFTRLAALHTAVAICGPDAAVARGSAAGLHRLAGQGTGPVDLVVPQRHRVPRGVDQFTVVTRTRNLPERERSEIDGLPVTSCARTLLDLAPTNPVERLAELTATGLRVRTCTFGDLIDVLDAHPNARGRGRLRAVLDILGDDGRRARSDVEVAALTAIVGAGLPRPVVRYGVFGDDGRLVAELDLSYPELRIAIEIDGFAWHSSPARKRADEYRQNRLVVLGWTVLRFSAADVRRRPRHVIATIRSALEAAGATQ